MTDDQQPAPTIGQACLQRAIETLFQTWFERFAEQIAPLDGEVPRFIRLALAGLPAGDTLALQTTLLEILQNATAIALASAARELESALAACRAAPADAAGADQAPEPARAPLPLDN